jgi:hypothetical protein
MEEKMKPSIGKIQWEHGGDKQKRKQQTEKEGNRRGQAEAEEMSYGTIIYIHFTKA